VIGVPLSSVADCRLVVLSGRRCVGVWKGTTCASSIGFGEMRSNESRLACGVSNPRLQ